MAARKLAQISARERTATSHEYGEFEELGSGANGRHDSGLASMLANRTTFQTDTIEAAAMHPDLASREADAELLADYEEFDRPDNLGLVKCTICMYGVFNEATKDTAMGYFLAMYYNFSKRVHTPQLYSCMADFWNSTLRTEFDHVPTVTITGVRFHFDVCMHNMNIEQRIEDQLDKIERVQDTIERSSLYVEPLDDQAPSDDDTALPPADRTLLSEVSGKLEDLHKLLSRSTPAHKGGVVARSRKGLSVNTEARICGMVGQMVSYMATMKRRRTRKPKRVMVSQDGLKMFDMACARFSQTAKVLLDWRKHNASLDVAKTGLPAYCSQKKAAIGNLIDIYSNKRIHGEGGAPADAADPGSMAAGDVGGRFAAY